MKKMFLNPDQIVTLRDYPVYNEQILKIYFRVFLKKQGSILPPCPVIHKSSGLPLSKGSSKKDKKYNSLLLKFLEKNPKAEYFLIDGSHKTTAATLARKKIPVFVFENDSDFRKVPGLLKAGKILGWYKPDKTLKASLKELASHHLSSKVFMTVADKTNKMVRNKILPKYMISYYKSGY